MKRASLFAVAALGLALPATPSFAQHHDIQLRSQAFDECSRDDWESYGYGTREACVEGRYDELYFQRYGFYPPD